MLDFPIVPTTGPRPAGLGEVSLKRRNGLRGRSLPSREELVSVHRSRRSASYADDIDSVLGLEHDMKRDRRCAQEFPKLLSNGQY